MKILTRILFLSLLIAGFVFAEEEEEEVRTMNKDGMIYKINNSSLHITPYDDNAISEVSNDKGAEKIANSNNATKEKKSCDMNLDISFGTYTAVGDYYTETTDPGTSMSIKLNCPNKISLFGQDFNQAYELSFANLNGINSDDMGFMNFYYVLGSSLDKLGFLGNLPFTYNFFGGLSDVDAINDAVSGIHLSLGAGVNYKLPIEKCDVSLYFSVAQTTDGENTYGLYSTGLTYGKSLNCSKSK